MIKDPRIARLLPFWRRVLDEMGIATKAVIPLRKPAEVAASLAHRDRLNAHQGQLIWLRYSLDAEYHSRGLQRSFVTYDHLLDDWRSAMTSVRDGLGDFAWPRQSSSTYREIDAFLTTDLRHHRENRKHTADELPWARNVWEILSRWPQGDVRSDDLARLDEIRIVLGQAESNFARVLIEHQKHGESLASRLREVSEALDVSQVSSSEREARILADADQSSEALSVSEALATERLSELQIITAQLTAALAELNDVRAAKALLENRAADYEARPAPVAEPGADAALVQTELETALAAVSKLEDEKLRRQAELEAAQAALVDIEGQRDVWEAKSVALNGDLEKARLALIELDAVRAGAVVLEREKADWQAKHEALASSLESERQTEADGAALRQAIELLESEMEALVIKCRGLDEELERERLGRTKHEALVAELEISSARLLEELEVERASRSDQQQALRQKASEQEVALRLITSELAYLRDDAVADAAQTQRLSRLVDDQEKQIARLKLWLASSQKNNERRKPGEDLALETAGEG